MDHWNATLTDFAIELRGINWLHSLADPSNEPQIVRSETEPTFLDHEFWSARTHELETIARQSITDANIDQVFDDVAGVMDEDLNRFNPIIEYFGRYFPDPVDASHRRDCETEMAHNIKRDLAWIAVERVIEKPGFFTPLLDWYKIGRWPCGWSGDYPDGHLLCL